MHRRSFEAPLSTLVDVIYNESEFPLPEGAQCVIYSFLRELDEAGVSDALPCAVVELDLRTEQRWLAAVGEIALSIILTGPGDDQFTITHGRSSELRSTVEVTPWLK